MRGVKVGKVNKEDLESELFQIVQKTAGRFVNDVERLSRRYRRLRVTTDLGQLRSRVENSLGGFLVGSQDTAVRRRRNHRFSSKRGMCVMCVMDRLELSGNEATLKIIHTMPHDEGDFEVLLPDDPDPAEVAKKPSFWRRVIQHAIHH